MKVEVAKHNISSHWCPKCKTVKEEAITDALPGFTIGNNALVYSALLHFTQGVSLNNIVKNMGFMNLKITSGCLVNGWHTIRNPWGYIQWNLDNRFLEALFGSSRTTAAIVCCSLLAGVH